MRRTPPVQTEREKCNGKLERRLSERKIEIIHDPGGAGQRDLPEFARLDRRASENRCHRGAPIGYRFCPGQSGPGLRNSRKGRGSARRSVRALVAQAWEHV